MTERIKPKRNAMPDPHEVVAKLDVIGELCIRPEKKPDFFVESKMSLKKLLKPPKFDSAGDSIELLATQFHRENQVMLDCQKVLMDERLRTDFINSQRIQEIYHMNKTLRDLFAEVNSFFKDCDDKKRAATRKISKERAIHDQLKAEISAHTKGIKELTGFLGKLKTTVREMEPYEKVMNEVVTNSKLYSSENDCIQRVDALMLVQTEIDKMKLEKLHEIEEKRRYMTKLATEASISVLGYINKLAEMERDFDQAKSNCLKWEKLLANIKRFINETDSTNNSILSGINRMFSFMCRRRGLAPVPKPLELELEFIREEIHVIRAVVAECKKKK